MYADTLHQPSQHSTPTHSVAGYKVVSVDEMMNKPFALHLKPVSSHCKPPYIVLDTLAAPIPIPTRPKVDSHESNQSISTHNSARGTPPSQPNAPTGSKNFLQEMFDFYPTLLPRIGVALTLAFLSYSTVRYWAPKMEHALERPDTQASQLTPRERARISELEQLIVPAR